MRSLPSRLNLSYAVSSFNISRCCSSYRCFFSASCFISIILRFCTSSLAFLLLVFLRRWIPLFSISCISFGFNRWFVAKSCCFLSSTFRLWFSILFYIISKSFYLFSICLAFYFSLCSSYSYCRLRTSALSFSTSSFLRAYKLAEFSIWFFIKSCIFFFSLYLFCDSYLVFYSCW